MIDISMQNLSVRHVEAQESAWLRVPSGWYATKISGTFVGGPYDTQDECRKKIAELNPPPIARRKVTGE